ncbi:hypothetical protein [Roseicella aerolata]|uniref:Uncharacterized protein n=1 Tax=Roseicella aerolata TaxID=2883479 RepID=A0A9X1L967_9PROT|nr:hypothetical protein [Roseicella aerolata]MCB4820748.1 hypothetical protein [Roseicella aerolata]
MRLPQMVAAGDADPLAYLLSIMRDPNADPARRDRAAIAALPYLHAKMEAPGKKAAAEAAAAEAERGTVWERLLS